MEEKQEFNGAFLNSLVKIKRWAKFLSILSYIGTALMVIAGVSLGVFSNSLSELGWMYGAFPGPLFVVIYLAGAVLYYFSGKYLGDMAKSAEMAGYTSAANHIESLTSATAKLFSFWGITIAIVIGLYCLIFILALVGVSGIL